MIICAIGLIVALVWFTFDIKIYKEQGNYFLFYTNIKGDRKQLMIYGSNR